METEELTIGRVHHGRNIRRTRIEKNMNQEGLSELVHLSQPAVSKYEKMKVIDATLCTCIECPFRLSQDFGGGCTDGGV